VCQVSPEEAALRCERANVEALLLIERSLHILKIALGPNHPDLAESLSQQANVLTKQVRPGTNICGGVVEAMSEEREVFQELLL